jgi:hypothetical protein
MLLTVAGEPERWVKRPKGFGVGEMSFGKLLGLGDDVDDAEAVRRFMAADITAEEAARGHSETREELSKLLKRGMERAHRTASNRVTKELLEEAYFHEDASGYGNPVYGHVVAM